MRALMRRVFDDDDGTHQNALGRAHDSRELRTCKRVCVRACERRAIPIAFTLGLVHIV